MLRTDSVHGLIESLDAADTALPNRMVGRSGFVTNRSHEATHDARQLAELGIVGVVPVGKYSSGDYLVLRATAGKSIAEWPVLSCAKGGEGARTVAANVTLLVAAYVATTEADAIEIFHSEPDVASFEALGRFFGDGGHAGRLLDRIARAELGLGEERRLERVRAAAPHAALVDFSSTYGDALSEPGSPLTIWSAFCQRHPDYAPGWLLQLRAACNDEATADSIQAAWWVLCHSWSIDNRWVVRELQSTSMPPPHGLEMRDWMRRWRNRLWRREDPVVVAHEVLRTHAGDRGGVAAQLLQHHPYEVTNLTETASAFETAGNVAAALVTAENACQTFSSGRQQRFDEGIEKAALWAERAGEDAVAAAYRLGAF